jgi:oxygen-independent coproporphyrinogen III oxidase
MLPTMPYIAALQKSTIPYEEEHLTNVEILHEYIMTSLRTKQGLDIGHVSKNFGEEAAQKITQKSKQWILEEKMILNGNYLQLTKQGKLFADGIAVDFFE